MNSSSTGPGPTPIGAPACATSPSWSRPCPSRRPPSPRLLSRAGQRARPDRHGTAVRRHGTRPADRRPRRFTCCFRPPAESRAAGRARASCRARTASSTGTTAATPTSTSSLASSPRRSARRRSASAGASPKPGISFVRLQRRRDRCRALEAAHAAVRQFLLAAGPRALPERGLLHAQSARPCRTTSWPSWPCSRGDARGDGPLLSQRRHALRSLLGQRRATTTACISRPATTRASSTASSRACRRFEPGTQGEHKISRGFVPTETWSAHWLSHPQFRRGDRPVPGSRARPHR